MKPCVLYLFSFQHCHLPLPDGSEPAPALFCFVSPASTTVASRFGVVFILRSLREHFPLPSALHALCSNVLPAAVPSETSTT